MKLKFILFIFLNLVINNLIECEPQKSFLELPGIVFDQFPDYNNNFEADIGFRTKGIILPTLNKVTRSPEIASLLNTEANSLGQIKSPELFKYFFNANKIKDYSINSGANYPVVYKLNLTLNKESMYVYEMPSVGYLQYPFFPIENMGFDSFGASYRRYIDAIGQYHNFHFCMKLNLAFVYKGFETFYLQGDDDHWIFINDILVRDFGGLQSRTPAEEGLIELTKLGLEIGKVYKFDYFSCERRTPDSRLQMRTNIELFCTGIDYCGVCGGSGEMCCDASEDCNDNNWCTNDYCPTPDTKIDDIKKLSDYCIHKVKVDPSYIGNKCVISTCNNTKRGFDVTEIVCPSKRGQCLKAESCNPQIGCEYTPICNGVCDVAGECNNGTCVTKTSSQCGIELDGKPSDLCFDYFCDSTNGCSKKPKCPQKNNSCIRDYCDPSNGQCLSEKIGVGNCDCNCPQVENNKCRLKTCSNTSCYMDIDPNDYNKCTIDSCDPITGNIINKINVTCKGGCNRCNPATGQCESFNSSCQDDNPCTTSICTEEGKCESKPTNCSAINVDGDLCKEYTCDEIKGCIAITKDCSSFATNKCEEGYCDSKLGCQIRPLVCNQSDHFCLSTECDEKYGCVTYDKRCSSSQCSKGVCNNVTKSCESIDYDPKPFICRTAAVVSTAVVAGIVVAGAVFLAISVFGGKKAYDYYKSNKNNVMTGLKENPFYETPKINTENPFYKNKSILYMSMTKLGKLFSSKDLSKSPQQQSPLS